MTRDNGRVWRSYTRQTFNVVNQCPGARAAIVTTPKPFMTEYECAELKLLTRCITHGYPLYCGLLHLLTDSPRDSKPSDWAFHVMWTHPPEIVVLNRIKLKIINVNHAKYVFTFFFFHFTSLYWCTTRNIIAWMLIDKFWLLIDKSVIYFLPQCGCYFRGTNTDRDMFASGQL